jgi:tetratricopeptide (TPR) repeat protein
VQLERGVDLDACAGTATIEKTMAHAASQTPELMLEKALNAGDASLRAKYATRGLSQPGLERETQQLLLRQLYLAHLEREEFAQARSVAEQMLEVGELVEPALHDIARACIALGDLPAATGHLRSALRSGPPHRRSLHAWNLGRVLYHMGQFAAAQAAFKRALRWATDRKSLYRVHAELTRHRSGETVDLRAAYEELGAMDPLPLYAEFLGAELLSELGEGKLARLLLQQFLRQVMHSSAETRAGLWPEIQRAQQTG